MPQGPPIIGQCGWRGGCLAVSKALAFPSNLANRDAFPAWLAAAMARKIGHCPVRFDLPTR